MKMPFFNTKISIEKNLQNTKSHWVNLINFIPKRIRIVASCAVMTLLLTFSTFFSFTEWWYILLPILLACAYLTTFIAIYEGIDGVEWYMLFLMPLALTATLYLFYFLLPGRWLTRIPLVFVFGFTYYASLLISNIFNVGVEKSIQLFRAAFSMNYLLQSFTLFLMCMVIFSFKQGFIVNGVSAGIVAIILSLNLYWSVNPSDKLDRNIVTYAIFTGFIVLQLVVAISFIPFKTNISSILATTLYYCLAGIGHHHLAGKLFPNIIREFSFVLIFVLIIAVMTLHW